MRRELGLGRGGDKGDDVVRNGDTRTPGRARGATGCRLVNGPRSVAERQLPPRVIRDARVTGETKEGKPDFRGIGS